MNRIRLLWLGLGILFLESIVLACLVPIFILVFSIQIQLDGIISVFYFTILFMMYKSAIELWLFLIVVGARVHASKPKLKDLIIGKIASGIVMLSVLIMFSFESSHSLDIFVIYVLMYIPSLVIAYVLFRSWWIKGVDWITRPMESE